MLTVSFSFWVVEKKIPASLATEGTMAVLAAVEKTLNDFEYLFSLMRRREPDN